MTKRIVMAVATALLPISAASLAQGSAPHVPAPVVRATTPAASSDEDARRAAAARLLAASRFRERQAVLLKDALRAAEAEMSEECLNRAAATSDMLDEVMAASQSIYARKFTAAEMDEITRFFRTPVGQHYGAIYPQVLTEVQARKRAIARRYLSAAAAATTKARP